MLRLSAHHLRPPAASLFFSTMTMGQPTASTHPHLLSPGELTPGLTREAFASRRARLAASLPPGSVIVVPSAPTSWMSHDVAYPYRADTDFRYLT
jgi:intermediate cleaving peptidase 55